MRYLARSTLVAVTGLFLLCPALAVIAHESEDRRVPLEPEITYERFATDTEALRIAETPPTELPVIFA